MSETEKASSPDAPHQPKPLAGKVALITGGGRGIGRGIALALGARGCTVAVNYVRNRSEALETVKALDAIGAPAGVFKAHVGDEKNARRLVDEVTNTLGAVDILVCNAASGVLRPLEELDTHALDWTLDVNARSIFVLAQATVPHMRAQGWGRILTISSIGARRVYPNYATVGVSKAAIEALTRYIAVEYAAAGIIANCICPGIVLTGALDHFPDKERMLAEALRNTPAGRLCTPEDVGSLAAWLCSDEAAFIVGQTIEIDGGLGLIAGT
jgi:enoyl-[acyl-carrier protein] reductase III